MKLSYTFMLHPSGQMHIFPDIVSEMKGACSPAPLSLCENTSNSDCPPVMHKCLPLSAAVDIAKEQGYMVCSHCRSKLHSGI